ncbi:MAG: hypothetical protein ABH878_02695 [bacterium]
MNSRGLRLILVVAMLGLMGTTSAWGVQFTGGKGLTAIQYPSLIEPGSLNITLHGRAFAQNLDAYTLSDNTGALSFHFGFSKRVEIGFTQIMYQDLNISALGPNNLEQIPDDAYLRLKVGDFPFTLGKGYFKFGVLNQIRYRTGMVDNIYLEPYSGSGISWELDLLFSYFSNPLYEYGAPAVHFNVGYLNHNDAGMGQSPLKAAQELTYALAYVYPTRRVDLFLETSGSLFLKYPVENSYSRESYQWITPGLKYRVFYGMNFMLGVDVLLWKQKDRTEYTGIASLPEGGPDFPSWRLNGTLSISPSTMFYRQPTFSKVEDTQMARKQLRQRRSLFEWVVDDQGGLEYINVELEKIKAERQKAEQELEKLKDELKTK